MQYKKININKNVWNEIMKSKINEIKRLNMHFYYLIKVLRKNRFNASAEIAKIAYEEFYNELSEMLKTNIN